MFRNFPHLAYTLPNGDKKIMKDIMVRIYYKSGFDNEKSLYTFYDVGDGERPEDVALKVYGSQSYHWVVLLFNDILDPYYEWYLSQSDLLKFTKSKYTDINAIKHYVDTDGYINSTGLGTPITNLDYETEENEKRRQIKILSGQYLKIFVDEFNKEVYGI